MKPTTKMKDFAERIAGVLEIEEPNIHDFNEVAMFIDDNRDEYYDYIKNQRR